LSRSKRAKAVCGTCIVRRQCLQYAIAANEEGVCDEGARVRQ
jgi:Transcription factor WhiB